MTVFRLRIADFPLLRDLATFIDAQSRPAPAADGMRDSAGDWLADVLAGPPVTTDRPRPIAYRRRLLGMIGGPALPRDVTPAALVYYPPGGAGIGWHTDSMAPGWRVYIGRPLEGVPGAFYAGNLKAAIVDDPRLATAFRVTAAGDSWHAVRAEGERFSVGLRIMGATARALGLP